MIRLSVLDQTPVRGGVTPATAVAETLALAEAADRLGYTRYWLAEHHASRGLAGSAPEILISSVAARTRRMRIGSGGVMLSHYSPLKVAESFRMLETLFPGRIDLGIGRAPGSDQLTAQALQHGPGALGIEHFPAQIRDLLGYLDGSLPADHPFAAVTAMPAGDGVPAPWLLGSSDQSAAYAAYFGVAYSFAHFINGQGGAAVMAAYRQQFRPSPILAAPQGSVGVFCICADSAEEADWLAKSRDLWFLRLRRGEAAPVPTPDQAEAYPYTAQDRAIVGASRRRMVVGTPETARAELTALAGRYGVEELVVVTICHSFEARLRSYELLAEAFALNGK
jgi:luciferase family oxidoreductase group 1